MLPLHKRHVDPNDFAGYADLLDNMVARLTNDRDDAPSYLIIGERKLGKTSFLLKLHDRLGRRLSEPGTRLVALPLYISCKELKKSRSAREGLEDLESFYRAIIGCVKHTWTDPIALAIGQDRQTQLSIETCTLRPGSQRLGRPDDQLLEIVIQDLNIIIGQLAPESSRLVLLIDDADELLNVSWAASLFGHLFSLLDSVAHDQADHAFCREQLSVVLASRPMPNKSYARRLLDRLNKERLHALVRSDVSWLLRKRLQFSLDAKYIDKVYFATGGHPWMVQYLIEQLRRYYGQDEVERDLDMLITRRFQRDEENCAILRYLFGRLPQRGGEILAYLAQRPQGATANQLVEVLSPLRAGVPLARPAIVRQLNELQQLGVVYSLQPEAEANAKLYAVPDIFRAWFLEYTGGNVTLNVLSCPEPGKNGPAPQSIDLLPTKPFSLLLSLKHQVLIADGLYSRFSEVPADFSRAARERNREARRIEFMLRDVSAAKEGLISVAYNLARDFIRPDWESVWDDYYRTMRDDDLESAVRFILKTEDPTLLDFPVELLQLHGEFLALSVPVFKEVIGLEYEDRVYHMSGGCFPPNEPLNVLLVASSFEGDREYPLLPHTLSELREICRALREPGQAGPLRIGEIVVLCNEEFDEPVRLVLPATKVHLQNALNGTLNDIKGTKFQILHYSGHYEYQDNEDTAGLILQGQDGETDRLSLSELKNGVKTAGIRMAYFSACSSAQHNANDINMYLGAPYTTLQAGVPVVIGMRWRIGDQYAAPIGRSFYHHLAQSGIPELALLKTRVEISQKEWGQVLWAAPVMLTR